MKAALTVLLVGLSIAQPDPDSSFRSLAPMIKPGSTACFVIKDAEQTFIAVDRKASTLVRFTDDKGTDLAAGAKTAGLRRWLDGDISKDHHAVTLTINVPKLPAEGATQAELAADVVLKTGHDPKTEQKPLAVKVGQVLEIGGLKLELTTIGKGWGDYKQKLTFKSAQPLDAIRTVEFLDAEDKVIESKSAGTGWVSSGGKTTYSQSFNLKQRLDTVTVKVSYFSRVVDVKVRLRKTLSLGL